MYVEPGTYFDLRYLNKKPKKRGVFSGQFDGSDDDNLLEIGTKFIFLNPQLT